MSRDAVRQLVVAASAVVAIVGAIVGSGFAGGTPIQDAAGGALSATATLVAPAGSAFSIWSIIYLGLIAYAIWQALPAQRASRRQRRIGYWVAASLILNAAWILSIQFNLLALSLPVIAVLLVVLVRTFFLCVATRPGNLIETILVDGTIGLYLGWVCVATVANAAALLNASGFHGGAIGATTLATGILAVTGIIGILLAVRDRGRIAPALSLGWGLAWIAVGRLTGGPQSSATAIVAIASAAIILVVTIVLRFGARRREARGA